MLLSLKKKIFKGGRKEENYFVFIFFNNERHFGKLENCCVQDLKFSSKVSAYLF